MPKMRVHELHPSLIHAPLALLPAAAITDLIEALDPSPLRRGSSAALWWAGAAGGLLAGLSGMAASQEVKTSGKHADEMMWLHGIGNVTIVAASLGMAVWRSSHRPTVLQSLVGLAACGAAIYTAYLGGELVYGHGTGVKALGEEEKEHNAKGIPLFSRYAPATLGRDAVRGLGWLITRTARIVGGKERLDRESFGLGKAEGELHPPRETPPAPI